MPPSTKYIYLNNNGATIYVGGTSIGETSQNRYYATTSCTLPSTSFLSSSTSSEPTSATVFDYSGKIFKEWNKSADGSGASYSSGDSYTATSTTDVLYAIWEDLPTPDVVISYNGNTIASLSDSGTEVLETDGTFMTDDVTITYTKSGGGGGVAKTVDVTLANPYGGTSYFRSCNIYETTDGVKGQQIGSFSSPTGTVTVTVSASANGFVCELRGGYVVLGSNDYIMSFGGVGLNYVNDMGGDVDVYFIVAYDGNAQIDHVDWDD